MIAKTADGQMVDLSKPENIRRGMVFRSHANDVCKTTLARHPDDPGWTCTTSFGRESLWPHTRRYDFLGMDPEHAARADCERFGIAPGIDAAAGGFTRTRDGFAVDLAPHHAPPAEPEPGTEAFAELELAALWRLSPLVAFSIERAARKRGIHIGDVTDAMQDEDGPLTDEDKAVARSRGDAMCLANHLGDRQAPTPPCCACGGVASAGPMAMRIMAPNDRGENQKGALCEACAKKDWTGAWFVGGRLVPWTTPSFAGTAFPRESLDGAMLRTLRIDGRDYNCLVTERAPRRRRRGPDEMVGPREVTAKISRPQNIGAANDALGLGGTVELVERDRTTRMLAVRWTRSIRPDAADIEDLEVELVADLEDNETLLRALAPGAAQHVFVGTFDARGSVVFGEGPMCAVFADGEIHCACGGGDLGSKLIHRRSCKVEPWAREAARLLSLAVEGAPRGDFANALGAAAAVAFGRFLRAAWEQTPAGLLAARDAVVAKAIADVPAGCDPGGWASVVRALAADNVETKARVERLHGPIAMAVFLTWIAEEVADVREPIAAYARARFVFGYSPAEALRWVLEAEAAESGARPEDVEPGAVWLAERLFAAYEAGR